MNLYILPYIDFLPLIALVAFCTIAALFFIAFKRTALIYRVLALTILLAALLNPSLTEFESEKHDSIALIVVDQSYSNTIRNRKDVTDKALSVLQYKIESIDGVNFQILNAPNNLEASDATNLFQFIDKEISNIPPAKRAGVIIISDGNIHDIPKQDKHKYGPIHMIVTGEDNEYDRRIEILKAPLYALKGEEAQIDFIVKESITNAKSPLIPVRIRLPDGKEQNIMVPSNKKQSISVPIAYSGKNPLELLVLPHESELTQINNRHVVLVEGIRDKLNVLLVSGAPHEGGRYWRSLLKSDSSIELVHFTILRDIDSRDPTPRREMALIPFPHKQLFHDQLDSFDLIIFDRYRNQGILQRKTYENIARYVREGGAILVASGEEYAGNKSIYNTALRDILIGNPSGRVYKSTYTPQYTNDGLTHPITRGLKQNHNAQSTWSEWFKQVDVVPNNERVLLKGYNDAPLFLIGEKGNGRIAHLTSDQIWLWARGYNEGGPYINLMRRMIHWLLKEPTLEEGRIDLKLKGRTIYIERYGQNSNAIEMVKPEGIKEQVFLEPEDNNILKGQVITKSNGLYSFASLDDNNKNKAYIVVGNADTQEYKRMVRNKDTLKPLVRLTNGQVFNANEVENLTIRLEETSRKAKKNILSLAPSSYEDVTNIKTKAVLPLWFYVLIFTIFTALAWRRHSK